MISQKIKNKKNLKKLFLRITIFLVFSGLTASSVLLIKNGDNHSQIKRINNFKTLINDETLKASSFEFVNESSKTIRWRSGVTLPKQLIIKYYKSSSLNAKSLNDNDYKSNAPTNLVEGDNIYIKFFIKQKYKTTYKFANKFNNLIEIEVKNNRLMKIIATSNFKKSLFEIIGKNGSATIKLKSRLNLPNEVEVRYAKSNHKPVLDSAYSSIAPINLRSKDIIYIKFFIKDKFKTTHKLLASGFTNPILFMVNYFVVNNGKKVMQNSSGNIWAMGYGTRLRVFEKTNGTSAFWINKTSSKLLKGSNINNGDGVIFEDSKGNIWAMGKGTPIQVLVKKANGTYASSWTNDNTQEGLLKDSNITNGWYGTIFEDSKGNIWAMGLGTPLQVLVKKASGTYASSWINDNTQEGLLKDSNITDGYGGVIFEDSKGNIWAMADETPLQVLEREGSGFANSWINNRTKEGLLLGSKITSGVLGTIFEDSNGNLWAMGHYSSLQVLQKEGSGFASSWTTDKNKQGLLKGSNITNGIGGTIFEDLKGNLWAMGYGTPLQVLIKKADGTYAASWTSNTSSGLLKNSNITDGSYGAIFEDSHGNIWAMGNSSPLQVLIKKADGTYAASWTSNTSSGLLKSSKINNGADGTIFEDSDGSIWAMGYESPLQVLRKRNGKFALSWTRFYI